MLKQSKPTLKELEAVFWDRVSDMQLEERLTEFNERKSQLKEMLPWAEGSKRHEIEAALSRLNVEVARVNRLINHTAIMTVVRDLFGQEGYEAVRYEVERRQGFPYAESKNTDETDALPQEGTEETGRA